MIWILAIVIGTGMRQKEQKQVLNQVCQYFVYVAFGLYLIVGAKLAWIKCKFFL